MDLGGPQVLTNIFTCDELELIPEQIQNKFTKFVQTFSDEYYKEKAASSRLDQYEQEVEVMRSKIQDYEMKLINCNQNVDELRIQLDKVSQERIQLNESITTYEKEIAGLRIAKNIIADERDSFHTLIERQNSELDRLKQELRTYQLQLKNAINAKCEALARVEEIGSKETALDFKENRIEQERNMLNNRIKLLTDELNRTNTELQNIHSSNTAQSIQLETRLNEKVEELKIVQEQCVLYRQTVDNLTQTVQDLNTKILKKNEDTNKMMEFYKKELEAKSKLADLCKNNFEDTIVERSELRAAISDLKQMLTDASEQYGELETKYKATVIKLEQIKEEKDKAIDTLKSEIKHANDLLKQKSDENVDIAISKIAPSAAVASRLIRTDMSLTEIYSLYVSTSEELDKQKRENSRLQLEINNIVQDLRLKAPIHEKRDEDHQNLIASYQIMTGERNDLLRKNKDLEDLLSNTQNQIYQHERENKKLKTAINDLSRQVCNLLKEIEHLRVGITNNGGSTFTGNLFTTDDVISKKLVTFSCISELQENNQKLLLLVRDLSTKLEEAETIKQEINESSYKEKIENYTKKIQTMQDTLNQQTNTVSTLLSKCERYKKMYFELQKQNNSSMQENLDDMDESKIDEHNDTNQASVENAERKSNNESNSERRIRDLENQLQDIKDQYKTLKEQYEYYSQEKKNNEKLLNEQFDAMRTEVRELTSTNCKLMSSLEYTKEQLKLQQKNIATYKQQIVSLEDRNKNYESTIVKHEQTLQYLKDELLKAQRVVSSAETETKHLHNENNLLKNTITRLQSEKEIYYRDQQNQNMLLNNIELIKTNLERSEMEGRARLEQRLDDTVRELAAQRWRFQEEEDRFRETTNNLRRQTETAKLCMEEEKEQANKLRAEMISLREEIVKKSSTIDELSKKLQESLTPSKNDNPILLANKKAREFEIKYEEAKIDIESLQTELEKSRKHAEQYFKMSQSAETEIKKLHEVHSSYVSNTDKNIEDLKRSELNLKSRITELESEIQLSSIQDTIKTSQPNQLTKTQEEMKDVLQKLSECNRNLRSLRMENTQLTESLNAAENKYAHEMILHSTDIQEMSKLKAELNKVQDKLNEINSERDTTKIAYEELKQAHKESICLLQNEKDEYENRVKDLNIMNSNLHNQIEALSNKLALITQDTKLSVSTNESILDNSVSDLNQSNNEEDNKNYDQLLQIIKFLRKEKDITVAKLDILKAENTRLISEQQHLQKKIDDLNEFLSQERANSEKTVVSATKHEEILRKIESFDALTDSNRVLREERNSLCTRNKELNQRISVIEEELFPLQAQNREYSLKIEEITTENSSLRIEAMKWRQRANVLVEKTNKNPEEFKRLQMERENLAKMLTSEKEILKQTTDDLNSFKAENTKLEAELLSLQKQLQTLNDENKKLADELSNLKHTNARIIQEVMELKNKLLQREEIIQKQTESIEVKEAQLQDLKNKEVQIRKIAKRYKDSYLELSSKKSTADGNGQVQSNMESAGNTSADNNEGPTNSNPVNTDLENLRSIIEKLNDEIRQLQEEKMKHQTEYDELKNFISDAQIQISTLSESKMTISQELIATKSKLEAAENNHDEIRLKLEENIARMEKELTDLNNTNKEVVSRLTRENESLSVRLNNLNRLLGPQQSAKPCTSSIANSEKGSISESSPRTANVKPMSGSATVQQSATVTPWRGSETPLASIRPISVQNSRTAAILPTSQQIAASGSSTSSTSLSGSNTALVPPQQQVHTTGSSSVESMSSSPTSSHTDYMPSTSSASVAVAAVPPMGSTTAAESTQEAESVQQPQQNDLQPQVSGGQSQVVALVSPRVEGSIQTATSPNLQVQQDSNNQQPSTSGTTSSTSHIAVSSHNRHTPSSSNVTTTQAGSSGIHKRPRDLEGDSSTGAEESGAEKPIQQKRLRTTMHGNEAALLDVEYQVPTSSQRDQEDEIVVVDSEEEDGIGEADDGPADGDAEHGYEDSYEPDMDIGEHECPEVKTDSNEVDVDECVESQTQYSKKIDNQNELTSYATGASTSQAAAAQAYNAQQDNRQQSQTISSGSFESSISIPQPASATWKPQASSTFTRQQKSLITHQQSMAVTIPEEKDQDPSDSRQSDNSTEIVSSPQGSRFGYSESGMHSDENDDKIVEAEVVDENIEGDFLSEDYERKEEETKKVVSEILEVDDADDEFIEEVAGTSAASENVDNENKNLSGASQSEIQEIQHSQNDISEGVDGVSSEGEKQAIEDIEEEGREAEATSSPSINTRSKSTKGSISSRRPQRGYQRGNRPIPITWQDSPANSRNVLSNQRSNEQPSSPMRGYPNQRSSRARRLRRASHYW